MGSSWLRGEWRIHATPLIRRGQAAERGTAQLQFSSGQTPNFYLSAFKFSPAKAANPLVIERIPIPERIAYAQDRESLIETKVSNHIQLGVCLLHHGTQSDCWMIV